MKKTVFSIILIVGMIINVWAAQSPQVPLPGSAIPQFMEPLPTLGIAPWNGTITTIFGNQPLTIRMCEFDANILPAGTIIPGVKPKTRVWGYLYDPLGNSTCAQLIDMYKNPVTGALDTYIGPAIVNQRVLSPPGLSTDITWINDLGYTATTQVLAYKYSTDQTLHWADPFKLNCMMTLMGMYPMFGDPCAQNYEGPIPAVTHLHGGEVPPEIDGGPDSWFTSDGMYFGSKYYTFGKELGIRGNFSLFKYPNVQEAAPIWFHDHTLGATRLNVYMGLAGAYYIYDPSQNLPPNLQPLNEVVPLVIQDRMFDTNGQLFFPADSAGGILWSPNPEHPYWVPEFVGDVIVVNGKAWPYLNVQPKRYRFLILNGSNARTYELFLVNPVTKAMGPPMWVIATDGGYLDTPVKIDPNLGQKLVIQPGERYEIIIDFAGYANTTLIMRNTGRTPYPKGTAPNGNTVGRIIQFRVGPGPVADNSYNPASGIPLRTGGQKIQRLANPLTGTVAPGVTVSMIRQLTLNEVMGMPMCVQDPVTGLQTCYPGGPLEILLNNTKWSGHVHGEAPRNDFIPVTVGGETLYYSEIPKEGDTEIWEIVNLTADAHPIHLHLTQFQILNRQNFNLSKYLTAYNAAFGTNPANPLPARCMPGMFCPAYGPPLDYNTGNPRALGGNPDITPYLQGKIMPPMPWEAGWKDTAIAYPGQVLRIIVRFAPQDKPVNALPADLYYPFDPSGNNFEYNYVWHCHIVDHEDNEMMRPDVIELNPFAPAPSLRPLRRGWEY